MKRFLNRAWFAAAASLVSITSLVNADYDDAQLRNLENRVGALEQRRGANGMINPNGRIQVKGSYDVYLTAELLYWEAHENGLEFVVKNDGGTSFINDGEMKQPDFDWNAGSRIGLGYYLPHDGWDVYLSWLHYTTDGDREVSSDLGGILFTTMANPDAPGAPASFTATKAESDWKLRLNQIDLDLGREFYVSKWLTLRPHMGLRAAAIRQKHEVTYTGGTVVQTSQKDELEWKCRYKGLGPSMGVNTSWMMGQGWSLFGDVDLALLYGFFVVKEEESLQNSFVNLYDNDNHYHISRAVTDLALGLRYDFFFYDDCYHIRFQVAWENHMYYGLNQNYRPVSSTEAGSFVSNLGDLTLQGWTFGARFDF